MVQFPSGLIITSTEPIDCRLLLTNAEMLAISEAIRGNKSGYSVLGITDYNMPDKYFCISKDNGRVYYFYCEDPSDHEKHNDWQDETGYFKVSEYRLDEALAAEIERAIAREDDIDARAIHKAWHGEPVTEYVDGEKCWRNKQWFGDDLNLVNVDINGAKTVNTQTANIETENTNTLNVLVANIETGNINVANIITENVQTENIDTINALHANIEDGHISNVEVATANITNGNIENETVDNSHIVLANIETANVNTANIVEANINHIDIDALDATDANIDTLDINVEANINSEAVGTSNVGTATVGTLYVTTQANINSEAVGTSTVGTETVDNLNVNIKANINDESVGTSDIGTAGIGTANIGTANIGVKANINEAAIGTAGIGDADIATLDVTTSANIKSVSIETTTIDSETVTTSDITTANIGTTNVGTLNVGTKANINDEAVGTSAIGTADITTETVGTSHVTGTAEVDGATTLNNTLSVTGATSLHNTLTVDDNKATVLGGTLEVKADTQLDGNLSVTGTTILSDDLTVNADVGITGSTTIHGPVSITPGNEGEIAEVVGTFWVVGTTNLSGSVAINGDYFGVNAPRIELTGAVTTTGNITTNSNLYIEGQKTEANTENATKINSLGKVEKVDLTTISPAKNGKTLEYIDTISQNSVGKISATKKEITLTDGGQGTLTLNDSDITITNLTTSGKPTFTGVTLSSAPSADTDATTKKYVDDADSNLQSQIDTIESRTDVIDVVACYDYNNYEEPKPTSDIVHYDTASGKISDKDIVKVLIDETHNDAVSYYRYSTSTSSFSYVGSVEAYYTKAETDAIELGLQNQIDKDIEVVPYQSTALSDEQVAKAKAGKLAIFSGGFILTKTFSSSNDIVEFRAFWKPETYATNTNVYSSTVATYIKCQLDCNTKKLSAIDICRHEFAVADDSENFIASDALLTIQGLELIRTLNLRKTQDMISPDYYDATATYNVGDVVIYQNDLYECNTAISTAEAWTAVHWTKTSASALNEKYKLHIIVLSGNTGSSGTLDSTTLAKVIANPQNYAFRFSSGYNIFTLASLDPSLSSSSTLSYANISANTYQQKTWFAYISINKTTGAWTSRSGEISLEYNQTIPAGTEPPELKNIKAVSNYYKVLNSEQFYPAYNSTYTYSIGDIVSYLGKFYICISAISTAEAWTAAHWSETNPGTQFIEIASGSSGTLSDLDFAKANAQVSIIKLAGEYFYKRYDADTPRNLRFYKLWKNAIQGKIYQQQIHVNSNKTWQYYDNTYSILEANPTLAGTEANLTGLQVGDTKYKVPTQAQSLAYSTTAPTADNTDGLKIVVLDSEPATRYNGYLYIITEE